MKSSLKQKILVALFCIFTTFFATNLVNASELTGFMDVPWGATREDVNRILKQKGFSTPSYIRSVGEYYEGKIGNDNVTLDIQYSPIDDKFCQATIQKPAFDHLSNIGMKMTLATLKIWQDLYVAKYGEPTEITGTEPCTAYAWRFMDNSTVGNTICVYVSLGTSRDNVFMTYTNGDEKARVEELYKQQQNNENNKKKSII